MSTEAYYCLVLTLFTSDSELTKGYGMLNDTLRSMIGDKEFVPAQTWRTLSWKMICNDAQFFSVRTSADDLYNGENLPSSVLHFVIPPLKSDNQLVTPANIPRQWTESKHKSKKRRDDEQDRNQRRGRDQDKRGGGDDGWFQGTHPKLKTLMEPYSEEFDSVFFSDICTAADTRIADLPESMRNICFNHILGKCRFSPENCYHKHVKGSTLKEDDVDTLIELIQPGVEKTVEEGSQSLKKRRVHRGTKKWGRR